MSITQKRLLIVSIICSVTGIKTMAQFSDSVHHNIGYAATGIINQTDNTNSFVVNNNLKFNVNKKNKFLNSSASWVYGKQNGTLTNNDFNSTVNFDIYGKVPNLYYWGLAAYDKSLSLKINDRFQGGLGIGYDFLNKKEAFIGLSDGILYEYSDLQDAVSAHDTYRTLRNSLRLKYHFVWKEIVVFDGVQFWQPSFSSGNDYVLKSINSLSIRLKKWLSLTSAMTYNKVNRTQSKNFLFTAGVTADYYF